MERAGTYNFTHTFDSIETQIVTTFYFSSSNFANKKISFPQLLPVSRVSKIEISIIKTPKNVANAMRLKKGKLSQRKQALM